MCDEIIYGLTIDPQDNRTPIGLIAKLAEHCIGIAEVRVRIPVQASFIATAGVALRNCEEQTNSSHQ